MLSKLSPSQHHEKFVEIRVTFFCQKSAFVFKCYLEIIGHCLKYIIWHSGSYRRYSARLNVHFLPRSRRRRTLCCWRYPTIHRFWPYYTSSICTTLFAYKVPFWQVVACDRYDHLRYGWPAMTGYKIMYGLEWRAVYALTRAPPPPFFFTNMV